MRITTVHVLLYLILGCCEWRVSTSADTMILRLCVSQKTCENCLQASSSCAWCSDWSYSNLSIGRPRCNVPERLREFGCPPQEIRTTPEGSIEFLEDSEFQDMVTGQAPIQLRPQRIKVRIPAHSQITIPIRYRLAKNYPLDLYYLMDLTWTMKDDKETLVTLGSDISRIIHKFSNQFRLGFGSYADKPLMPYVFPGHEENPCKSLYSVCAPLYSYWHHLELTDDTQRFVKEVNDSLTTANVDNLEGALDAIVQAIVCTREVGWEPQARKIILVATDGLMHFAGDGKLGGAVRRSDFKCHLDHRGQYSLATDFDYPSLAELSRILQEHKINLIFAVTEQRYSEYASVVALLKETARVAILSNDSSNILEIIESAYHQITSKVILRDDSPSWFRVDYFSNCGKTASSEWNTAECNGIQEGEVYTFNTVLSLDQCPKDKDLRKQTIVIQDALASEVSKVVIDVELLCGCSCKESKSPNCERGVNECGVCKCDIGWSGETCDCNDSLPLNNVVQCIGGNSSNICSEKGECICGKCSCDEGYKGEFCECSACDQMDGIECSNKGTCQCGVCQCIDGWQGNACQCPSSDDICKAPGNQEICAGHGYCDCGECRCNVTAEDGSYYRGTYCESSIGTGGSSLCILYNPCVNATVEDPKSVDEFCHANLTSYVTEVMESVDSEHEHYCFIKTIKKKSTCIVPYVYEFQENNIVLLKIGNKRCQTAIHGAVIPSAVFIGTALLGIISLLIWKCWTVIQDRKEYEKFMQEQKKTVFSLNENPLFKPATSRFTVPQIYKED